MGWLGVLRAVSSGAYAQHDCMAFAAAAYIMHAAACLEHASKAKKARKLSCSSAGMLSGFLSLKSIAIAMRRIAEL